MISTQRTQRFLFCLPITHNPDKNTEITEPPNTTPKILNHREYRDITLSADRHPLSAKKKAEAARVSKRLAESGYCPQRLKKEIEKKMILFLKTKE